MIKNGCPGQHHRFLWRCRPKGDTMQHEKLNPLISSLAFASLPHRTSRAQADAGHRMVTIRCPVPACARDVLVDQAVTLVILRKHVKAFVGIPSASNLLLFPAISSAMKLASSPKRGTMLYKTQGLTSAKTPCRQRLNC